MKTNGLVAILVLLVWGCSETPPTPVRQNVAQVESYFEGLSRARRFSGVVLVGEAGEVTFHRGFGWADIENQVPNNTGSILRIGSLTKPFTASAVLIAANSNLLSLNDLLCDLLEGCPESWSAVTLRWLLTHTSGIVDHSGDLDEVSVEATGEELARMLSSLDPSEALLSAPGEKYAYSNFNYVLLGVALEKVYGRPWDEVLEETVFAPLGLRDTAYDDVWSLVPRRARGYHRREDGELRNIEYDDHGAYAAGGLRSTVGDLFAWSEAVFSGALLGKAATKESFTPYLGNYGYGWQIREFFGRKIYNHTGGIDGFSSHIAHYPEEDLTIIILSNVESDSAILSACDAAAVWLEWREVPVEPTSWLALEGGERCGVKG